MIHPCLARFRFQQETMKMMTGAVLAVLSAPVAVFVVVVAAEWWAAVPMKVAWMASAQMLPMVTLSWTCHLSPCQL